MSQFTSDKVAFEEVSRGNLDAYRYLFDNHFADLCNFLLIYLHKKEVAEEIALDIFAYIWEKRDQIQVESFKSYVFSAGKNRAINHYRKERKRIFEPFNIDDFNLTDTDTSQRILENKELQQIISAAINQLPEKSRIVYQLAWEQNMTYKEIAGLLGLSVKTIENHVGIALRKLRNELKPYYKQIFIFWLFSNFL